VFLGATQAIFRDLSLSDNRYSVYLTDAWTGRGPRRVLLSNHMDFAEFERLVLRVLFETNVPLTASHIAYLGGLSVKTAERHLARMAEEGTLLLRANAEGQVEYYFPGRRALGPTATAEETAALATEAFRRPPESPLTAVLLSMLIPGAGHIYSGRAGAGVAWMASTMAGYAFFFLPGLFLHGLCMVSAAHQRNS
jgi:TM2 domain-containing membrane protein YozV